MEETNTPVYQSSFGYTEEDLGEVIDDPSILRQLNQPSSFSHEMLVMKAYVKVLETSAKEMRKGFWETKTDKFGNATAVYNPDTRQELINSVITLDIITFSDQDQTAKNNIKNIYDNLAKVYKNLCDQEHNYYNSLRFDSKAKIIHVEGRLNQDLPYYHTYIQIAVDYYREIFKEIEMLLSRTKYFKKKLNKA